MHDQFKEFVKQKNSSCWFKVNVFPWSILQLISLKVKEPSAIDIFLFCNSMFLLYIEKANTVFYSLIQALLI
jgi:hypothetical protein